MARFYITNTAADWSPGTADTAIWQASTIAGGIANARHLGTAPAGTSASRGVAETSSSSTFQVLLRQFVSYPATAAGQIAGNWQLGAAWQESSGAADLQPLIVVWVTVGDTSEMRGLAIAGVGSAVLELSTSPTGSVMGGPSPVNNTVEFEAGDRIVVELGYQARNTVTTSYTGAVYFGGTSSPDMADGVTNTNRPGWVDIPVSAGVSFEPPGDEDIDASDSASGAESAAVDVFQVKEATDTAAGVDSATAGQPKDGSDTASTAEGVSMDAELDVVDSRPGVDVVLIDAALTAGTDPASTADAAHIIIPAGDEADTAASHHIDAELGLVDSGAGADGAVVETLWGDLVITLFAVHPDTGALVPLPDFVQLTLSPERNSRGSIGLQYPATGRNFTLLRECVTTSRDLEVEIWSSGSRLNALHGYLQEAAGDDTEEGAIWQFGGGFLELRMDEAVVFPQDLGSLITDPDTGEQTYSNAKRELIYNADTPGAAVITILDQAQDRGALDDITWDFTTEVDSNGTEWSQLLTAKFSPGSTYTQILDKLVELGLAEWAVVWDGTDRVLKLWEPEGRGVDRTTGPRPVILRKSRNLLSAPMKWSVRESGTTVLAAGSEGLYDDATDATALARRGRRIESYSSLGNATDESAVLAWAQQQLAVRTPGTREVTLGLGFLPGEPRPLIAFDVGDWIYSQVDNVRERLRVVQWTLTVDAEQQPSGTVTLNDTMTNTLVKLQRRLNQIAAGEAVVGTSEPPSNNEPDTTPPAAPEGLAASSFAYQDPSVGPGQTLAMVSVGWLPVTTNADGSDDPRVQAAVYIREKLEQEIENPEVPDPDQEDGGPDYDPIQEDWTWRDCPQVVQDFNDALLALYVADGSPNEIAWLGDFIDEQTQTPTAADDIAGYRVRYSYLGLEQVGGIPSSDPFPESDRVYYEATPPGGTSATNFEFGGIEGGSRLRIEVAAFDRAGNQGAWSSISHDTSNDATPPPVPSSPTGLKTWFRTLDVPWDGLGSEGEAMPVDFSHVRVWVGQGASFTLPAEVVGPVQFDPTEAQPQYVRDIPLGAGTVNIPDLPVGVGWYAALQAVDRSGNASELSAVAGPVTAEQLVGQDILDGVIDANKLGPDSVQSVHIVDGAITTAKIVDAAIVSAKIGEAQINSAHIDEVSAGKISAGTMEATVTVSGGFWTSLDTDDTRLCFTGQGLQLYRAKSGGGSDLVGEWRTSDGGMLVTGTFQSALAGQRIMIDPDGSFRIYPESGTNYSKISNESGEMVWRGPLDGSSRSGRVNVNVQGVGLNFSRERDLLENIRAEFLVLDRQTRMTAPFMNFIVSEQWTSPVGGAHSGRRIQFSTVDSDGEFIEESGVSYFTDSNDNGGMAGNGAGWKFEANQMLVTGGLLTSWGTLKCGAFAPNQSSREVKRDIEDIRKIVDPLEAIRSARARRFNFTDDPADTPPRLGVIAEEMPEQVQIMGPDGKGGEVMSVEVFSWLGLLHGAINQLLDQETRIVTGRALVPNGQYRSGDVVDVPITWDAAAPEVPSDVTATALASMPTAMGRIRALVVPDSATTTGCTVRLTFTSALPIPVTVNNALPIAVEAVGRYIYTPPPPTEE